MRSFLLFIGLLAGALLLASAVTYPAWVAVGMIDVQPVHRVMQRLAMLFALFGLIALLRREGLSNRAALGYALPRPQFVRQMGAGFALGLITMLPLIALLFLLGIRYAKPDLEPGVAPWLGALLQGLATGITVAFIEETFFRGAMQTAIRREAPARNAILLTSLIYAALHFLGGRLRIPAEAVDWTSGFVVLTNLFERYSAPGTLIDSYLALVAVGVLLGLVRERTGAIAACIGLHAGWVCVITTVRSVSNVNEQAAAAGWVGSYDGVIGWAALALIATLIALYVGWSGPLNSREARNRVSP